MRPNDRYFVFYRCNNCEWSHRIWALPIGEPGFQSPRCTRGARGVGRVAGAAPLATDLGELLGERLSAIVLRCELARRLVHHPHRSREELAEVVKVARRALTDAPLDRPTPSAKFHCVTHRLGPAPFLPAPVSR